MTSGLAGGVLWRRREGGAVQRRDGERVPSILGEGPEVRRRKARAFPSCRVRPPVVVHAVVQREPIDAPVLKRARRVKRRRVGGGGGTRRQRRVLVLGPSIRVAARLEVPLRDVRGVRDARLSGRGQRGDRFRSSGPLLRTSELLARVTARTLLRFPGFALGFARAFSAVRRAFLRAHATHARGHQVVRGMTRLLRLAGIAEGRRGARGLLLGDGVAASRGAPGDAVARDVFCAETAASAGSRRRTRVAAARLSARGRDAALALRLARAAAAATAAICVRRRSASVLPFSGPSSAPSAPPPQPLRAARRRRGRAGCRAASATATGARRLRRSRRSRPTLA